MLKTILKYTILISIFCCTFTSELQAAKINGIRSKHSNVFYWDCDSRFPLVLLACRFAIYRDHNSHSRTADFIEPKTKRDSKVFTQQFANQIQAMPTTHNLVAILYWSKLTNSLAYGVAAKDSSSQRDLKQGRLPKGSSMQTIQQSIICK